MNYKFVVCEHSKSWQQLPGRKSVTSKIAMECVETIERAAFLESRRLGTPLQVRSDIKMFGIYLRSCYAMDWEQVIIVIGEYISQRNLPPRLYVAVR